MLEPQPASSLPSHQLCVIQTTGQMKESESRSVLSDFLWPHGLYSPWNSPGQNTGVGSLSLLRGIFSTQVSNPGLPYCSQIFYQLSHIDGVKNSMLPVPPTLRHGLWYLHRGPGHQHTSSSSFSVLHKFQASVTKKAGIHFFQTVQLTTQSF